MIVFRLAMFALYRAHPTRTYPPTHPAGRQAGKQGTGRQPGMHAPHACTHACMHAFIQVSLESHERHLFDLPKC